MGLRREQEHISLALTAVSSSGVLFEGLPLKSIHLIIEMARYQKAATCRVHKHLSDDFDLSQRFLRTATKSFPGNLHRNIAKKYYEPDGESTASRF
jgi:hypothetical protein